MPSGIVCLSATLREQWNFGSNALIGWRPCRGGITYLDAFAHGEAVLGMLAGDALCAALLERAFPLAGKLVHFLLPDHAKDSAIYRALGAERGDLTRAQAQFQENFI